MVCRNFVHLQKATSQPKEMQKKDAGVYSEPIKT